VLPPARILTDTMARTPRVVIIGAGIVGCSLADELVLRGWSDVTVIEQGGLFRTGGSTSHAPGIIFQTNASKTMQGFAQYTVEKATRLQLDGKWCLNPVGSLELALTSERLAELHRRRDFAESWGLAGRVIDPDETVRMWPLVDRTRIVGAYHVPSDGLTDAVRVSEAQARRAMEGGARFLGAHTVTAIRTDDDRVRGVVTDRGEIPADVIVCAAGIWGPRIGAMVGMTVALQPLAHQLTWTTPLPELLAFDIPPEQEAIHPNIRVQDRDMYYREYPARLAVGSYGHVPMPVDANDLLHPTEAPVMPSILEFTPDTFAESWAWAEDLVPALRSPEARIERGINGIFSFTPDGFPLMGESADIGGFWLAEAVWVTHALGVGRAMAEWLVDGRSTFDLHECDLNRFEPHQMAPSFIHDRGIQNYVEVYDIVHPLQPMEEPRSLRTSPFYEREGELGAYFLEGGGWERPHWYGVNEALLGQYDIPSRNAWAARYWHPIVGAEARATRDQVAMFDITPLKRIAVEGPGAAAFLDRLTTNRVDRPVGTVVYSLLLDARGGVRSDLTIARLAVDRFQVGANGPLDLDELERRATETSPGSVAIRDVTNGTCCIGLWGPKARDVLASVTDADLSNEAFGYFRAREIWVGSVPVTALRLSYVGELGWELYTSADMGLRLWDTLWTAGREHGVIAAGRGAFGSLRLEKGYRFAGVDMTTEHDPYEAGLGFAVRMDKGDFVGRDALIGKGADAVERRLVPLLIDDPAAVVMGKEPVHIDGRPAGYVTSAGFGYSIGSAIAYTWLPAAAARPGQSVTIRYFGEVVPARVAKDPLFDPEMRRLRS
jgi:glycine cleavage system aminomethyltransferase T/glycine/D-amino acid oxidase-like deaminating enzyme